MLSSAAAPPVLLEFLLVQLSPIKDQLQRTARETAFQNSQLFNINGRLELPVDSVEMGGGMIAEEHSDQDSVEDADRWHRLTLMIAKSGRIKRLMQSVNTGAYGNRLPPTSASSPRSEDLKGGGREENVEIARSILNGAREAKRDIVLVNAAATLVAAGKAANLRHGMALAAGALDSGAAREKIEIRDRLTQAAP
jgi:hypothetical protein